MPQTRKTGLLHGTPLRVWSALVVRDQRRAWGPLIALDATDRLGKTECSFAVNGWSRPIRTPATIYRIDKPDRLAWSCGLRFIFKLASGGCGDCAEPGPPTEQDIHAGDSGATLTVRRGDDVQLQRLHFQWRHHRRRPAGHLARQQLARSRGGARDRPHRDQGRHRNPARRACRNQD